jgi:hypothetical protein
MNRVKRLCFIQIRLFQTMHLLSGDKPLANEI